MFAMIRNELPINGELTPTIRVGKDWFRFFANLFNAASLGNRDAITEPRVTASPMIYTTSARGQVIVSGGTVSAIAISRDGTTYYDTGETAGVFALSAGDLLKITYAVAPTMLAFMPL